MPIDPSVIDCEQAVSQATALATKRPAGARNTDRAAHNGIGVPISMTHGTTARTIITKSGIILPATIDQSTDFNMITTVMTIYYQRSSCLGSFAAAVTVADAVRSSPAPDRTLLPGRADESARAGPLRHRGGCLIASIVAALRTLPYTGTFRAGWSFFAKKRSSSG